MRIVGLLAFYDESPSWLSTAVSGMARVCDEIVACDGAYSLYPGGRARSRPDQSEAILGAAEAAGAGCTIHRPKDVFHGQEVAKRNLLLGLAAPLEPDWVVVFDADMHVLQTYPDVVRRDLGATGCNVATYTILDGADMLAEPDRAGLAARVPLDTEWTNKFRGIYRWLPALEYGPTHFSVSGYSGGERVWLRGALPSDIAPACDLGKSLVVHHRRDQRALVRRQAADRYCVARTAAGYEAADNKEMLVT
mgnify:CR=1 FL=1